VLGPERGESFDTRVLRALLAHPSTSRPLHRRLDATRVGIQGDSALMKLRYVLPAAVAVAMAGGVQAQNALIDYQGYAWETGGFPPSDPLDVLNIVGVVDALDTRFGINLLAEEVTLHVTNLTSAGGVDIGGGVLSVAYAGGTIDLWRDPSMDHDYGINPPNATAPTSFTNGSLFLGGTFVNFFLFFDPATSSGVYEGSVSFTSGSGLTTLNQLNANGYTFGGVLDTNSSGGNLPEGYDLQVDGTIEVEVRVGVEQKTWKEIKDLYRR
jgi:hypothetical protein